MYIETLLDCSVYIVQRPECTSQKQICCHPQHKTHSSALPMSVSQTSWDDYHSHWPLLSAMSPIWPYVLNEKHKKEQNWYLNDFSAHFFYSKLVIGGNYLAQWLKHTGVLNRFKRAWQKCQITWSLMRPCITVAQSKEVARGPPELVQHFRL